VRIALGWLQQDQLLAFLEEGTGRLRFTRLGEVSARSLPLNVRAGFCRYLRGIIPDRSRADLGSMDGGRLLDLSGLVA